MESSKNPITFRGWEYQQKEKSRLKSMKQTKQRVGEFAIINNLISRIKKLEKK